jgi:hypothetical protein
MEHFFSASAKIMQLGRVVHKNLAEFFLTPATARPLGFLRIGVCLVLLIQAYFLRHDIVAFCSTNGYLQGSLADYLGVAYTPKISLISDFLLKTTDISEASTIIAFSLTYVISLFFVCLGLWTKTFGIISWFTHWTLMSTNLTTAYGLDLFANVFLFYFMIFPVGDAFSLDSLRAPFLPPASWQARLGLRMMQIHLCIAYLASGIEKSTGVQWWNGEILWRVSQLPVYKAVDLSWVHLFPQVSMLAGWGTLLLEVGFCIFIWPKRTRIIWIPAIVGMHLGIIFFMGLHLFGAFMAVLTPAIFGISPEPVTTAEANVRSSETVDLKKAPVILSLVR